MIDGSKVQAPLSLGNDQTSLLFGSKDNHFYSINSITGKQNWNFSTPSMIVMGACFTGNNTVIFGNLEGDIYALNKSGHLLWTYKTDGRVNTPAIGKKF